MEQEKKIDVVYIGLHPETPRYLNQETRFNLVAVALLDCFGAWTINPANWLLKITYKLRTKEQFRLIELFFWHLSYGSCFFSSGIFRRYAGYIRLLSKQGIAILDTENEELLLEYIKVKNIDLIIVNSWGILSEEVVSAPRFGMINIHPSKLPKYRGALPTLWALKNQDSSLSVTFMLLNRGIDTGKILHQHEFEILKSDSAIDLERKIDRILKKHLNIDVLDYLDGKIVPYEQDESLASMTGKYEAYRLVDWKNERAMDIFNKIMAYPYIEPGVYCYFYLGEKRIELRGAMFKKDSLSGQDGQITVRFDGVSFQAKGGIILSRLFIDLSFKDSLFLLINGFTQNH